MSSLLTLTVANIRSFIRDRAALFWTLAFPLIFILLFGTIFSGGGDLNYKVGWVDQDQTQPSAQLRQIFGSIGAFTILHHPDFAGYQSVVNGRLSEVASPQLQTQMRMPLALGVLLSSGVKGAFCAVALFGLLASQLGNVTMSAVESSNTSEVGGLQGTFQNLGLTFGTALVGSVFLLTLTSGFTNTIANNNELSGEAKTKITDASQTGVGIVSKNQAYSLVIQNGGSASTANIVSEDYQQSQLKSLRISAFFIFTALMLSLVFSTKLPKELTQK
jgi:hypothetical protein